MKTTNSLRILSQFFMIAVLLSGCSNDTFTYCFRQDSNNVEKIEICSYDHNSGTRTPIIKLEKGAENALMEELSALECHQFFPLDPILSYGDKVIYITYYDGEVEMIGEYNIGWITPSGKLNTTNYYFDLQEIRDLIEKYAFLQNDENT